MNINVLIIHVLSITLMLSAIVLAAVLSKKPGINILPSFLALVGGFVNVGAMWVSVLSAILFWVSFLEFGLIIFWGILWSLIIHIEKKRDARDNLKQ